MLSSTMDAYLSVSGNRMNKIMKRLTSISTILMSVTLIAGIYGMNFTLMPELRWRYGYVYALALNGGRGSGSVRLLEEGEMDMKLHMPSRKRKKGDTAQLAAQLAPLEELRPKAVRPNNWESLILLSRSPNAGFSAIVVDNDNLHVPKDIHGREEAKRLCWEWSRWCW